MLKVVMKNRIFYLTPKLDFLIEQKKYRYIQKIEKNEKVKIQSFYLQTKLY